MYRNTTILTILLFTLAACGQEPPDQPPMPEPPKPELPEPATPEPPVADEPEIAGLIDEALAGDHRSADNRSRDTWRNPKETLMFFGLEPDMTVVEIYPGGGWYTEVLAPVLRERGELVAAHFMPEGSEYRTRVYNNYMDKLAKHPGVYDQVEVISIGGGDDLVLGEDGSADMVLTFRNMHSFTNAGEAGNFFEAAYSVLKPGGILGVVAHRASDGADAMETVEGGYLPESFVIEHATAAGFQLDARSEVNANPSDTRDHPEGVWTLPPTLRLGDEDRDMYEAIGESDRMTLRFVK